MKRIKWEPFALMVLLLLLGAWLVARPSGIVTHEGARTLDLKLGSMRGVVEVVTHGPALSGVKAETGHTFRILTRDGAVGREMGDEEFRGLFGEATYGAATATSSNWAFRLLNITSWTSLVWVVIGFGGQFAFTGRMLLQWFISEKRKESVVPEAFWWLSLIGGMALFAYFVWRQDFVAVLGQSSGVVIYARNLRLIYKQRRRARVEAAGSAQSA
ncbi:MAG: lipid-A-disaccharide synthase N-terminal domain-containing protein [Phycisphaerales bacterium]